MSEQKRAINNIWIFLGITFGATWLLWIPGILQTFLFPNIPEILILVFAIVATFVPSIMGFVSVGIESGKSGMRDLLRRGVQFKGCKWCLTSVLLFPILITLVHAINFGIRGIPIPLTDMVRNEPWKIPFVFLMGMFTGGPIGQEFGWRGYALPQLQKKYGGWISALMVGVIGGVWYLPAFFIDGIPQRNMPVGLFLVTDLLFSFIIAFLQNISKGSLVPAIVLHTLMNLTMETMPLVTETGDGSALWIANIMLGIACIFLLIFTRPKDFSSRFSLQPAPIQQDLDHISYKESTD